MGSGWSLTFSINGLLAEVWAHETFIKHFAFEKAMNTPLYLTTSTVPTSSQKDKNKLKV